MDDHRLQEIQSRKYTIVAPERSPIKSLVFLVASICLTVITVVALALLLYFALGGNTAQNVSVARLQPLQGTPIVLVGNWPQDRTPTPTVAPTLEPTLTPKEKALAIEATKRAQPTPDPRWSMPFCNDSTTLELTPCLPYAVTTPTPQPTPTPLTICTAEDFQQDAANIQPCLKAPNSGTPVMGTSPTPTFAVPTPYIPVSGVMSGSTVVNNIPHH